jgi:hypothetical protein
MASVFNTNTGKVDRIIRVVVGALLVGNSKESELWTYKHY